jgi:hypothetical protein
MPQTVWSHSGGPLRELSYTANIICPTDADANRKLTSPTLVLQHQPQTEHQPQP